MDKKVDKLIKEFLRCQGKSSKFNKRATKALNEARELCKHPTTRSKDRYYSGSYDTHASTQTDVECDVCGKHLRSDIEEHSWYG